MAWDDIDTADMATLQRDVVRAAIKAAVQNGKASVTIKTPQLADTIPPTHPPAPVALAKPRVHHLVAWRHDGGLRKTAHATRELAMEASRALHYTLCWKFAIMDGRDMVYRELINEPSN